MMKYDIVLFAPEHDRFIESLRETGMVDITTSGWEPSESDRNLLLDIEARTKALATLDALAAEGKTSTVAVDSNSVFASYTEAQGIIAAAKGDIARLSKSIEEWREWGEVDITRTAALAAAGVSLRYFVASSTTFEKSIAQWSEEYNIVLINGENSQARFVVIGSGNEEINIDAQEIKAPTMSLSQLTQSVSDAEARIAVAEQTLVACAAHRQTIASELATLKVRLQNTRIAATATQEADGLLLVLEGWAEESNSDKVDALLDSSANTVYIKSNPTPEDNTPVKLKNNRFARIFELVGNMYALPKYGTVDLTPFFAPFYMLFFAICLCDAGYGAVILAAGLALLFKGGVKMRQAALFSTLCGAMSVVFGFFANSFFGMSISDAPIFENFKFINFQEDFFVTSMVIGIIQILFGMAINLVMTTKAFGIRNALGSLGWFMLILSSCLAAVAGMVGIEWFGFGSVAYMVVAGIALVFMLLLNRPSYNIFANFGVGLWDTYNNITGLLSDVLSYIRLFAIGLSGGVLALVFNSLALGLTGLDGGIEQFTVATVFQILGASVILLIGHGINLFMSTISSFVHPMRLTFVEFFKNAGFEMGTRAFEPLTKEKE
ncbi:MAG: V-type ATP synthase subunit I [Alistipes sp.]|nr:V-type ATP synthase subunit I [Alistipes sp.]